MEWSDGRITVPGMDTNIIFEICFTPADNDLFVFIAQSLYQNMRNKNIQGICFNENLIVLCEETVWITILSQKLFVFFTFCHQSYPLLNTEMDSFMKYYFTTFMKNLFVLASTL